jgi:hypothetical protein
MDNPQGVSPEIPKFQTAPAKERTVMTRAGGTAMSRYIFAGLAPVALLSMTTSMATAQPATLDDSVLDDVTAGAGASVSISVNASSTNGNGSWSYVIVEKGPDGKEKKYEDHKTIGPNGNVQLSIVKQEGKPPVVKIGDDKKPAVHPTGVKPLLSPHPKGQPQPKDHPQAKLHPRPHIVVPQLPHFLLSVKK